MKKLILAVALAYTTSNLMCQVDSLHSEAFTIHAQTTTINQSKLRFSVPYSGENSLRSAAENQTSLTSTLFLGAKMWKGASIYFNPELAGGSGLSGALGVAASTNGETFRVGDPSPTIYVARIYYKQIFALTDKMEYQASDFNQLAGYVPTKYIGLKIGKIGMADFFDMNKFSHDPRTHFISWGLMNNGAWDYPANTRGYTPSAVLEYVSPVHEWRYALSLVPVLANGSVMNWDVAHAYSHTLEYTHKHSINGHAGAVRLLAFYTAANMGHYLDAVAQNPTTPDISLVRKIGNTKYGFAMNAEQDITSDLGVFVRGSWNDGKHETWMFTEIDHSVSGGLVLTGERWKRKNDNIGLAFVASGISPDHIAYLKAGGNGFMLGDGNLNYGWEKLTELYYMYELKKDMIYLSGFYQLVFNPGYNKDRQGPVNVFSLRLHVRL
jgi:high affinity Mn2+ porin